MKLLLDEHFSPAIAEQLQGRGYEVLAIAERVRANAASLRRRPDDELLIWARREGRVLVTENVRDFMPLHHAYVSRGETHAGILFTSPRKFPRSAETVGTLVNALVEFLDTQDAEAIVGNVAWLQLPR